jgi:hypothetical protein
VAAPHCPPLPLTIPRSLPCPQFAQEEYAEDLLWMGGRSPEEVVGILRRGSVGFARHASRPPTPCLPAGRIAAACRRLLPACSFCENWHLCMRVSHICANPAEVAMRPSWVAAAGGRASTAG